MKITPNYFNKSFYIKQKQNFPQEYSGVDYSGMKNTEKSLSFLDSKYNDYLLSFGARVDKGLARFYEVNKTRMPVTVRNYIESLPDKKVLSPMEAQRNAFEYLQYAETIDDIKGVYGNEKLFENLINPQDSKAKRGILYSIRENEELLALSNQATLKNKENLTVYLVKKIFLEGKTLDEINADLENDLDEDFKADFKFKNKENINKNNGKVSYVLGSTIKALGIQTPEFEYQQSLRYTREGYSDFIGDRISGSLTDFYESLTIEERTARAIKSYQSLENWWMSLPTETKLDMIADKIQPEELIACYKKQVKSNTVEKKPQYNQQNPKSEDSSKETKTRIKLGGTKLDKDELFIKWATHNLENFEKSLTPEQKESLNIKRATKMLNRWATMSPEERTEYISKMKSSSEPLRFAMIDAWNNSFNLLKDLSLHLSENQVYRPANVLYSSEEFSEFQSKLMKEFWQTHVQEAIELGKNIKNSQEKVFEAISQGTFEDLKRQILKEKNIRIKNLENYKNIEKQQITNIEIIEDKTDDYKLEFKSVYNSLVEKNLKYVPKKLYEDLFVTVFQLIPENIVRLWTRHLQGEDISFEDMSTLKKHVQKLNSQNSRFNIAFEAAIADTLYNCSNDASVYEMSKTDVKVAMNHLVGGHKKVSVQSSQAGKVFELDFLKNKIDSAKINRLYESYKQDLPKLEIDEIINQYFEITDSDTQKQLREYINQYGKSILIIFGNKSAYPTTVKEAFYQKFKNNMPKDLAGKVQCYVEKNGFAYEKQLQDLSKMRSEKFYFLPVEYVNSYNNEVCSVLRSKDEDIDFDMLKLASTKRTNIKDNGKLLVIPKHTMSFSNRLKSLAMTQALADVLYEITQNQSVYYMPLEQLAENIELFNLCRKFPTEERELEINGMYGLTVFLHAKKKPDIRKITKLYHEYMSEINGLMKEVAVSDDFQLEDFVYILNPDESQTLVDASIKNNLVRYNISVELVKKEAKEYYAD